jgi:hypothetical protein
VSNPQRFTFGLTQEAELRLAVLLRRATLFGVSGRLAAALKFIREQLQHNPREWGEPSHTLKGMRCLVHTAFHDRLRIGYLVHETQPVVFVFNIEPEPGHPLHRQE